MCLFRYAPGQATRWFSLDPCCTEATPTQVTCIGSSITRVSLAGRMLIRAWYSFNLYCGDYVEHALLFAEVLHGIEKSNCKISC